MSQHVTEPTHYRGNCTPNTLDMILTSERRSDGGEHQIDCASGKEPPHVIKLLCFNFCCHTRSTCNRENSYKYHKGDFYIMRKTASAKDWQAMFQGKSLDQCWNTVKEEIGCVSEKL